MVVAVEGFVSDERAPGDFPIAVTSFWGGQKRGQCIQLTPSFPQSRYAELDKHQVVELKQILETWLADENRHAAARAVGAVRLKTCHTDGDKCGSCSLPYPTAEQLRTAHRVDYPGDEVCWVRRTDCLEEYVKRWPDAGAA